MDNAASATFYERLPLPTIDRPFGIQLWPIFDKAWTLVTGYPASEFRFVAGETPMSTLKETGIFVILYYIVIFGGRELMRHREPFKLKAFFLVHNFYLTAISGILLALFIEQLLPTVVRKGIFYAICDHDGGWTQPLVVLYYVCPRNARLCSVQSLKLTPLLIAELPDQISRAAGHRLPVPQEEASECVYQRPMCAPKWCASLTQQYVAFLHCYHHGATAVLCYTQLLGSTSVSWVVISLNLTVHVLMYWYYFQSARGVRIWWKEWVTRLQIIQFIIDLGETCPAPIRPLVILANQS